MSVNISRTSSSSLLTAAVVGGIIGGILIDLYLIVVAHQPVPGLWQFVASTLVGPVAFTSTSYVILGLVLHFVTSIFWAVVYLYAWRSINSLSNWIVGGIVWGIVVMVVMTAFLVLRGAAPVPPVQGIIFSLIGHIVFYALPMTWYVSRSARA